LLISLETAASEVGSVMHRAKPSPRRYRRLLAWLHPRRWLSARELVTLTVLSLCAIGVWVFIAVADAMSEGELERIDERLVLAMRSAEDPSDPVGPRWLEEMMRDFTALGGTAVLGGLALATIVYLVLIRRRSTALMTLIAFGGGVAVSLILKELFDRPRPDLVPHGSHVYTKSFPSGHSMLSAVTYLTLGAVLARVQPRWRLKVYMIALALGVALLVGVSRVYLGVHWPSDVVAGWAAGSAWALGVWGVTHMLQRTGDIEPEPEQVDAPGASTDAAAAHVSEV
jgi:undecaprenyl-diphosphatase